MSCLWTLLLVAIALMNQNLNQNQYQMKHYQTPFFPYANKEEALWTSFFIAWESHITRDLKEALFFLLRKIGIETESLTRIEKLTNNFLSLKPELVKLASGKEFYKTSVKEAIRAMYANPDIASQLHEHPVETLDVIKELWHGERWRTSCQSQSFTLHGTNYFLRDFVYMKDCDGKYIVAQIHEIYLKELIEGEESVLYGSFLPFAISDHGKILAMMPKKLQCPIYWIVKLVTVGTE